jgi:hypothetical protein
VPRPAAKAEQVELGLTKDLEGADRSGTSRGIEPRGGGGHPSALSDGFAAPQATPTAESAKPTDAPGAKTLEAQGDADERPTATSTSSTGASSSRAPQYLAQARVAASRGDCAAVRTLMKRVAKEDAAAYRKALANDPALNKCVVAAQ